MSHTSENYSNNSYNSPEYRGEQPIPSLATPQEYSSREGQFTHISQEPYGAPHGQFPK